MDSFCKFMKGSFIFLLIILSGLGMVFTMNSTFRELSLTDNRITGKCYVREVKSQSKTDGGLLSTIEVEYAFSEDGYECCKQDVKVKTTSQLELDSVLPILYLEEYPDVAIVTTDCGSYSTKNSGPLSGMCIVAFFACVLYFIYWNTHKDKTKKNNSK